MTRLFRFHEIALAVDAMTVQIRLNPINKGQIGVADNWKRDQFFQNDRRVL